jgi:predicted esterase YcpF (UPF0227 family)
MRILSKIFFVIIILFIGNDLYSQTARKTIYLIPGQGSDYRIYRYFQLTDFDTINIKYSIPFFHESMKEYAVRLSKQIDTTGRYSIVGVSLGGMLAVEMSEFLHPEEVIIISSAKNRNELPFRYRFMEKIPVNEMFGGEFLNNAAPYAQIIVEPDSRHERETCLSMLKTKNELFMERSVDMIINWDRETNRSKIIHIHGTADRTLPIENIHDIEVIVED